ncbi:MAG TPA: PH domain-containing protein [Candidatus Pseudogracilibacillus intestinigallinarum]|uniref:PH domain-containing protein n=1 Tax=Candidatus Pseudogracilibacillus intestinigallinarum TaxID=2838742 RepID=A0A9D1TJ11_9BACI|nr:PH domain-containing protein [Candidatus Pseudogracilibacillus intestinigallinarum]
MKTTKKLYRLSLKALFIQWIQPSYVLVFTIFFIFYFIPEWWMIPIIILCLIFFSRYLSFRSIAYTFTAKEIIYQTALLKRHTVTLSFTKIDELYMTQTFFQKKLRVASIHIKCKDNIVFLPHIPLEHAREMLQLYDENRAAPE